MKEISGSHCFQGVVVFVSLIVSVVFFGSYAESIRERLSWNLIVCLYLWRFCGGNL